MIEFIGAYPHSALWSVCEHKYQGAFFRYPGKIAAYRAGRVSGFYESDHVAVCLTSFLCLDYNDILYVENRGTREQYAFFAQDIDNQLVWYPGSKRNGIIRPPFALVNRNGNVEKEDAIGHKRIGSTTAAVEWWAQRSSPTEKPKRTRHRSTRYHGNTAP